MGLTEKERRWLVRGERRGEESRERQYKQIGKVLEEAGGRWRLENDTFFFLGLGKMCLPAYQALLYRPTNPVVS